MPQRYLVGIGGANADLCHRSERPLVPFDSNPGRLGLSAGGVMRNICENCARLGLSTELLSAVGDDPFGRLILESCREAGVGVSHVSVLPGATSSVYVSMLDPLGDMAMACSDMSILHRLTPADIDAAAPLLRGAGAVCLDGNPTREVIIRVAEHLKNSGVALFCDPVSTSHAHKFSGLMGLFHTAKPNRLELEVLSGRPVSDRASLEEAAAALLTQGLSRVFVSLGAEGVYYRDAQGHSLFWSGPPLPPGALKNATGGGDAFVAGLLSAWFDQLPLEETLSRAAAAARLAVCCEETVCRELSLSRIQELQGGLCP